MYGSKWRSVALPVAIMALAGCGSDSSSSDSSTETSVSAAAQGEAQKGPFQLGASVTARDILNDGAIGTQSASTATNDARGNYEFTSLPWQGPTRVRVEGLYFDEITGTSSSESRYLDALLLAGQASDSNINLYTHVQSARIQSLMQSGETFAGAKSQAQQEWQSIAGTQTPAEDLNVLEGRSGSTETDSANLLLFSSALLTAGLSQQDLDTIRDDFADDGLINSTGETVYDSVVTAGQTPGLLDDARTNLNSEFGVDAANGNPSDIGWLPDACEQTRLEVSNRTVLCTSDDPIANLSRSGTETRVAAAVIFETPGHYRIEVSGVSGDSYNGNTWKLSPFDDQDTDRLCDRFESSEATGRSSVEGVTSRMNDGERTCLGTYYAPAPTNGGAAELRVGLVPLNDGGPSLDEAVPLALATTTAGKIGNYFNTGSDFPAYSYYQFEAPSDGTYTITVNGYSNLGSGSMRIALFTDQDNNDSITFYNDQERIDFIGGTGTDSTETVLTRSISAGTYIVRVFNGTGYRTSSETSSYSLTSLDLNIRVDGP